MKKTAIGDIMISSNEKKVVLALKKLKKASVKEIAKETNLKEDAVNKAVYYLTTKGIVSVEKKVDRVLFLGEEGKKYAKIGLPEKRAAEYIKSGINTIKELREKLGEEFNIAIAWLRKKGFAEIKNGKIELKDYKETPDEKLLKILAERELRESELDDELKNALKLLKKRGDVLRLKEISEIFVELTEKGKELKVDVEEEVGILTPEMLRSGEWRKVKFRRYDVKVKVKPSFPAKLHPLRRLIDEIREVFLQMGFEEIRGPLVESSFWNFDALFVPQDHPAREMQDTFYVDLKFDLPEKEIVERVRNVHENGELANSVGWRYKWKEEIAKQGLLRTHTTATTIRYLAKIGNREAKVFSIGRVFRKEKITFKHLPEFHQCEGIVVGKVTFRDLLGILKEFYKKMGFEKIRFRPSYFPYTEPSLEVDVYFEEKDTWLELGGAGIFRPEVTKPFGIEMPVLAWGLGLERLAMLKYGLNDIRLLYMSDIDWLKRAPLI